jgi:ABC-type iron transport system FetAB ATPase subunit
LSQLQVTGLAGPNFGPIEFSVEQGQCTCLSGPSGAGKTILLRSIADLDVHQGEVMIGADTCQSMSGPVWRQRLGFLTAHSSWWLETAGAHMLAVDEDALASLGLDKSVLNKPIAQLSTGELQRLALLRLLTNTPEVLLLDEPTASLDQENVARVETFIKQYQTRHNAAVLWVTHDHDQVKRVATGRLTIEQGRLTGESSW